MGCTKGYHCYPSINYGTGVMAMKAVIPSKWTPLLSSDKNSMNKTIFKQTRKPFIKYLKYKAKAIW